VIAALESDRPLRVAMVCHAYAPHRGGVETHVTGLAAALARAGVVVEVLTEEADRALPRLDRVDGVVVRRFPSIVASQHDAQAPGLWAWVAHRSNRYDAVHLHSYHAFVSFAAGLAARAPVVFTPHYHGTGHSRVRTALHRVYRPLGAALVERSRAVVCVSAAEADLVARDFPTAAPRAVVIPNAVDVDAWQHARPFGAPRPYVVTVGRLAAYKRVDRVVDAMARMHEADLVVIGAGPERARLERRAVDLGCRPRVRFVDGVDDVDVRRWVAGAEALVTLSEQEAFGLTVLEALAAGRCVVATDLAAHREVASLAPDRTRLVPTDAPVGDVVAAIRATFGRPRVQVAPGVLPTWDGVAARTHALYRRVARPSGAPASCVIGARA
jgi:glycosyltransferase involved in cell wall biosynthesis